MLSTRQSSSFVQRSLLTLAVAFVVGVSSGLAWETKTDALKQAIELIHDPTVYGVSTLSTQYPSDHSATDLAGHVITGPEYFAPCDVETGSLLYLGLTVSQTWRNVLNSHSKNGTVSIASNANPSVVDPRHHSRHDAHRWKDSRPSWRRGMPSKSRVTLFGHFDILNVTQHPDQAEKASRCYLNYHPDASHWAPNSTASPHIPFWATFNVDKVYWVGGFGDEHYIGWFSSDGWRSASREHAPSAMNVISSHTTAPLSVEAEFSDRLFGPSEPSLLSVPEFRDRSNSANPILSFQ